MRFVYLIASIPLLFQMVPLCSASAGEPLSAEERAAVIAVVDRVVRAGFPDTKGAIVYRGELKITARFDSATEEPQLPADLSKMQQTTDTTEMVYRYVFDGVHFHLKDGSWIVALNYRFRPRKGDEVLTDAAPKVDLAGLTAAAKNERPFDAEKEAATWLKQYEGDQRERVKEMMNLLVPVSYYIKAHADDWAVAFPLLQRAGWPDAAMSSLAMADFRARSYWQLRPWIEPDYLFDPTGQYPQAKESEAAWQKAHPKLKLEPVDVAFRRGLYRVIRAQFDADAPIVDAETAAACCLACLDPEDPQGNRAQVEAFLAASKLPDSVKDDAPLSERLQSWGVPERPRMVVSGSGGKSPSISTGFVAPKAYEPVTADLDALVALLSDERPSRFRDFNGIRTVGDNALRALTRLLKDDPRRLAGHPIDRSWSKAERKAAADAVQKWWQAHRTEYVK